MLLAPQTGWVHTTIGTGASAPQWETYPQVPVFLACFVGGCVLGVA